jgi:hypothetical protein
MERKIIIIMKCVRIEKRVTERKMKKKMYYISNFRFGYVQFHATCQISVTCIKFKIFVVIQNICAKILCDFFANFSDKKCRFL